MTEVSLSLKLQTVLNHLDEIDDVFAQFGDVEQALQWQARVERIRKDTLKEISRLDRQALRGYQSAQPRLHLTGGTPAPLQALSTSEHGSGLEADTTPPTSQ